MPQPPPRRLPEGGRPGLGQGTVARSEQLALHLWIVAIAAGLLWALLG